MTPACRYGSDAEKWRAVADRDSMADGAFVFGVSTTKVYCRPGCRSRRPRREHVRFFRGAAAAESAGYRACKRCAPDRAAPSAEVERALARACRRIEESEREPSLRELAAEAGWSAFHFQKIFKRLVGVTPKRYALEVRARRMRDALAAGRGVTGAAIEAGFGASGRAAEALGMRPSQFRKGGDGEALRFATARSRLGWVLVAAGRRGVCRIELGDSPVALERRAKAAFPNAEWLPADDAFRALVAGAVALVESPREDVRLPLDIRGTAFQRRVWEELRKIPAGDTATYAEIAGRIGRPSAARTVAAACAANTIAVAVPCHRVIRGDGGLGGYRWGVDRKRILLNRESAKGEQDRE